LNKQQINEASSKTYSTVISDRLCGLVVRVPGYRFRGLGSNMKSAAKEHNNFFKCEMFATPEDELV
jgi:hypothetical protein